MSSGFFFLAGVAVDDFFEVACFAGEMDHASGVFEFVAGVAFAFALCEAFVAEWVVGPFWAGSALWESRDDSVFDVEGSFHKVLDVYVVDEFGCVFDEVFVLCESFSSADVLCVEFVVFVGCPGECPVGVFGSHGGACVLSDAVRSVRLVDVVGHEEYAARVAEHGLAHELAEFCLEGVHLKLCFVGVGCV